MNSTLCPIHQVLLILLYKYLFNSTTSIYIHCYHPKSSYCHLSLGLLQDLLFFPHPFFWQSLLHITTKMILLKNTNLIISLLFMKLKASHFSYDEDLTSLMWHSMPSMIRTLPDSPTSLYHIFPFIFCISHIPVK